MSERPRPTTSSATKLEPIFFQGEVIASNFYDALGVTPSDSLTVASLRQAYLKKAAKFHPDKHPDGIRDQAAVAFSRISLAFRTLSDPKDREEYDNEGVIRSYTKTNQTSLTSGDTVYNALEQAKLFGEILPLLKVVSTIESAHKLPPGCLKPSTGLETPCDGVDCVLSFLDSLGEHEIKNKVLLCKKHYTLHQCNEQCTNKDRMCQLWAAWHVNKYRHEVASSWTLQISSEDDPTPKRQFWYNTRAGISIWKDGLNAQTGPPSSVSTPHTCTQATCQTSGYLQLDAGVWVCRASSTGHICTPTQCHRHWRQPLQQVEPVEAVPKEKLTASNLICWSTGRACQEGCDSWDHETSERPINVRGQSGVEKRVVTFHDERTGQTIKSLVERPIGTDIGEAVEDLPPALRTESENIRRLNIEQTKVEAEARELEQKRLARLKKDHDAFNDEDLPSTTGFSRGNKRCRSFEFAVPQTKLKQLKRELVNARRRARYSGPISEHSDDDDEGLDEGAALYNTYNILDAADYDQSQEIGDYQTQYTAGGGVEGILEEYEDDHEAQAAEEYLEYAQQQFLDAAKPNAPVEWHGDPSVGKAHPAGGALRIYGERTIKICERPPLFKPPEQINFDNSEKMQLNRKKQSPRVRAVDPRTRARLRKFAHRIGPPGSTSPNLTAISRESSPTPSGADRMDLGSLSP